MRTNVFITNQSVKPTLVGMADLNKTIGFVKASTNGSSLLKNINLVFKESDYKFYGFGNRETRVIPISLCDIVVKESIIDFDKLNYRVLTLDFDFSGIDLTTLVGEDLSIRIVIPTEFNHRNSWNFSHRVVYGDTADNIKADLFKQIANSSLVQHLELKNDVDNAMDYGLAFYLNPCHNTFKVMAMDSMPPSAISFDPEYIITYKAKEFINKIIVDADANYGFDYVNCPEGDFYPNKMTYKQAEKLLFDYAKLISGGNYNIGLTHITFNEPRIIETTGDVVKQVVNIIHPLENKGNFVKSDYTTMISLISE